MNVLCYGDSNTYGYDPRSYLGSRYEEIWPELLARDTGWNVVNWGENGREIPKTDITFPVDTDLLIVMLGTNDLLQFWTPKAVSEKMEKFLYGIQLPKEKILLIAPPPMKYGEWVQDQERIDDSITLATEFQALARRLDIRFVDAGKWDIPLTFDGVHMSQEGHSAFALSLHNYLTKGEIEQCWKPV